MVTVVTRTANVGVVSRALRIGHWLSIGTVTAVLQTVVARFVIPRVARLANVSPIAGTRSSGSWSTVTAIAGIGYAITIG